MSIDTKIQIALAGGGGGKGGGKGGGGGAPAAPVYTPPPPPPPPTASSAPKIEAKSTEKVVDTGIGVRRRRSNATAAESLLGLESDPKSSVLGD